MAALLDFWPAKRKQTQSLRSDSTTVPLPATKLGNPRDAFQKVFQKSLFELIEKR